MTRDDALNILDLATSSYTLAQLKTAYREALMIWHPDRFEDGSTLHKKATLKTQEINEAYRLLISSPRVITERFEPTSPPVDAKPKKAPPSPVPKTKPNQNKKAVSPRSPVILSEGDIFCCRCGEPYHDRCKTSFLGLRRFDCSFCGHKNEFPPTGGYLGCCWLIFLATAAIMALVFSRGGFAFPGLFGILAFLSLASAYNAKARVRRALEFHRARQRQS
jgi:hypothetical protein